MGKKNLVTLKNIYVDKEDENDISMEEFERNFIEALYQLYMANKGNPHIKLKKGNEKMEIVKRTSVNE